jgi:predicted nucleotidyltransferase
MEWVMQDANERLFALAERVAAVYTAGGKARASAVLGSVARRQSDAFSDIDLGIYYETMPTEEEIVAGREALAATHLMRLPGGSDDGIADIFTVDGVECQIMHCTVARIDADLSAVLDAHETEHEKHAVVGGILDALPLFGEDLVIGWQRRAAAYPDALAQAMVRDHLRFWPYQMLEKRIVPRDAPLFFHKALIDDEKTLLSALSGLNRLYPQLEFKRLDAYVARMHIAPPRLAARLKQLLQVEPLVAVAMLRAVIEETFALVERHMPAVDTAEARKRFAQVPRGLTEGV